MWGGKCVDLYEKDIDETRNRIVKSITSKDLLNIQVTKVVIHFEGSGGGGVRTVKSK